MAQSSNTDIIIPNWSPLIASSVVIWSRGVYVRHFVGMSVIVGLGVGLNVSLSVGISGGFGFSFGVVLHYTVGINVGLSVGLRYMVGLGVVRGVKTPPWMNLLINTNTSTNYTKENNYTKATAITFRKNILMWVPPLWNWKWPLWLWCWRHQKNKDWMCLAVTSKK